MADASSLGFIFNPFWWFWIRGPSTGNSWTIMRDWSTDSMWTWYTSSADVGDTISSVRIRDGHHEPTSSYDLADFYEYTIVSPTSTPGSWSEVDSGTTNRLTCVWVASGSDVFAVGYDGAILHYKRSK